MLTIRERPKSAPYPRLKNSKRTSKFPSFGELGLLLWKNFSQCRKNWKGGPFGIFHVHSVAKLQKIEGGTVSWGNFFWKKSHSAEKIWRGDLLVSSGIVCYAGNLFGSVPWANGYILGSSEFWKTFGRTILVSSGGLKKTLTKSHDYSRLFS